MLENAKFIKNLNVKVEDRDTWRNMGFNDRTKQLTDKGGIPNFTKTIHVNKKIKSAHITATALGIFDVFINDKRVGEPTPQGFVYDELKPGWTDYSHRVFAYTYDVTELLMQGENHITAEVSCGWYSCRISFGIYGFRVPAFCCELNIEYEDGTCEQTVTDESWNTALCGPVRTADIWDGEYYDARYLRGVADKWEKATAETYDGEIVPAANPRILVRKELERKPQSAVLYEGICDNGTDFGEINICKENCGEGCEHIMLHKGQNLVLDMGQNLVGRPRIRVKAEKGTKLTVLFGEFLNDSGDSERGNDGPKGSLYIKNYRSALSRFVYVASGNGEEVYAARHTFFGYRYLELETDGDTEIISVNAEVVSSANRETAEFECSNSDVNKLWSNIVWGQRSNYLSIPTDCPQRDERLGWTGDTQIFCGAGSYIADIYDFMSKWLQDVRDTQGEDGSYCDVIPKVFSNPKFIGNAAWSDAGIIVPFVIYKKYGKIDILREHYDSMERYMNYVSQYGLDGANTAYGDWLAYEPTDKRYVAMCYYAHTAMIMSVCSSVLGKADKASYYFMLFKKIRESFAERYTDENGLTEKTQTAYLIALKFHMLPESIRRKCIHELRQKIEDNDYMLSTGFLGTGIICMTLSELGMHDLCYDLLLQTKNPSWLYSVRCGATTVWERWNSYTSEKGFGDVNMNSFNHYAYGAVAEWMIAYMAGIRAKQPGFSHVLISPKPDFREKLPNGQERITYVKASYNSASGMIKSSWRMHDDKYVYEIEVPCKATLEIPHRGNGNISVSCENPSAIAPKAVGDVISFEVEQGKYIIEI